MKIVYGFLFCLVLASVSFAHIKKIFLLPIIILFFIPCLAQMPDGGKVDDLANAQCDDYLGRTMEFANQLKQTPDSKGFVILYEGKTIKGLYDKNAASYDPKKYVFPRYGLANELIRTMKTRFFFFYGIDKNKLTFIKGGFRENLSIELWIVPNGTEPPKPAPTLEKMHYRKGKPRGYCITI